MSRFHVGQRVRIIHGGQFAGRTGTVVEVCTDALYEEVIGIPYVAPLVYAVNADGHGEIRPSGRGRLGFLPHHLEPLRDDDSREVRQETTTWDKCVWKPAQVSARVSA